MPRTARQVKKTLDAFISCNNKYKVAARKSIKSYAKFRKLSNSNPKNTRAITAANNANKKDSAAENIKFMPNVKKCRLL